MIELPSFKWRNAAGNCVSRQRTFVGLRLTKGAMVAFTRSLSENLAEKKIRVNGVAPGPVWTPLIPATFPAKHVSQFGSDVPMDAQANLQKLRHASCFLRRKIRLT